jgi:hypothetical protein
MLERKNVGGLDRNARLVLGPVLAVVGVALAAGLLDLGLAETAGLALAAVALVVGVIFIVTGTTQKCPANEIAGINTYDESE